MMADYYAHLYSDDPKALDAAEDDDFDPDAVADIIGAVDDWDDLTGGENGE